MERSRRAAFKEACRRVQQQPVSRAEIEMHHPRQAWQKTVRQPPPSLLLERFSECRQMQEMKASAKGQPLLLYQRPRAPGAFLLLLSSFCR